MNKVIYAFVYSWDKVEHIETESRLYSEWWFTTEYIMAYKLITSYSLLWCNYYEHNVINMISNMKQKKV